jgi:hypothetical protein
MASAVVIANLALSHLGADATVASLDPPDGSVEAEHCAQFFDVARDVLLEMHNWSFATTRVSLAATSTTYSGWTYAYALPGDCLRVLTVFSNGYTDDEDGSTDFQIEADANGNKVILSNEILASARFTRRVTDTTRFSPLFTDALTWLLAAYVAGPLLKGDTGTAAAKLCYGTFTGQFAHAAASDANQSKKSSEFTPGSIAARA